MDNIAAWMGLSFQHVAGSTMRVNVLRGTQSLTFNVVPTVIEEPSDRLADLKDLYQRQIPSLGIMAITLDKRTADAIGPIRLASGVVVIARSRTPSARTSDCSQAISSTRSTARVCFPRTTSGRSPPSCNPATRLRC